MKKFPDQLLQQSSAVSTEAFGCSHAADVLRRNRQLVLVSREFVISYTKTHLILDERGDTLQEAILTMILDLDPLDGPSAVNRVDLEPGFIALQNNDMLHRFQISLDIGRVKNTNKNPVAEKAVSELEEELLCQEHIEAKVFKLSLTVTALRLNSHIIFTSLSAY